VRRLDDLVPASRWMSERRRGRSVNWEGSL
jgi:hypothetical protein